MRKPRLLKKGALYHVTARANRKEMIFDSKGIGDLFLQVVRRAKQKYDFRIENFCIMGNHYHLMIRPGPRESLSRIMQWIMSVFAMAYNRLHGYTGHVWSCRFFSRIIWTFWAFMKVFEYIDANPVKANRVSDASKWRYGGLWHEHQGYRDIIVMPLAYTALAFPGHAPLLLSNRRPN